MQDTSYGRWSLRDYTIQKQRSKSSFFQGRKLFELHYHLVTLLNEKLNNVMVHIGTNDAPYKKKDGIYEK